MLKLSYCYYYHMCEDFPAKEVREAILNKDFDKFISFYKKWHNYRGLTFLPDSGYAYADEDYDHMVIVNILNEYNFKMITDCEYECG